METLKDCRNCGRSFSWRKKWQNEWPKVKFCSKKCSGSYSKSRHLLIKKEIIASLKNRSSSICPSEIARKVFSDNWGNQMENIRAVARLLAKDEFLIITQKNIELDPDKLKGPIRLKLK
jgi:hypothetical protein